jgi:hypothetical protein
VLPSYRLVRVIPDTSYAGANMGWKTINNPCSIQFASHSQNAVPNLLLPCPEFINPPKACSLA